MGFHLAYLLGTVVRLRFPKRRRRWCRKDTYRWGKTQSEKRKRIKRMSKQWKGEWKKTMLLKKGPGLNKGKAEKETRGKTSSEYEINFLEKRSSWKSLSPGAAFNFHLPSRFSFRSPWPLQYDLVNYTNLLFSAFQFRGRFTRSKVRIVRDPPSKASFLRCDLWSLIIQNQWPCKATGGEWAILYVRAW